ncbi:MAG: hypothetical protein QNL85_07160 [Euryarchaeota archaeon]
MEATSTDAKAGLISMITGVFGLYLTASMWFEFQAALSNMVGASMAVIISTTAFLVYQSKKNVKETAMSGSYELNESFNREGVNPLAAQSGRHPVIFMAIIYMFVVLLSEMTWSDLIF